MGWPGAPMDGEFLTLGSVVPNPFRNSARIAFTLGEDVHVKLRVFDLSGRAVRTLLDERPGAGRHEVAVSGTGLPHGILFYSLEAGSVRRSGWLVHLEWLLRQAVPVVFPRQGCAEPLESRLSQLRGRLTPAAPALESS